MQRFPIRPIFILPLVAVLLGGCGSGNQGRALTIDGEASASDVPLTLLPPRTVRTDFIDDSLPPVVARADPPPPEAAGARPAEQCDPNYEPCVPVDSDVDCAGGRGNGPSYVAGPVAVVGSDVYGLDRDHDGTGCER